MVSIKESKTNKIQLINQFLKIRSITLWGYPLTGPPLAWPLVVVGTIACCGCGAWTSSNVSWSVLSVIARVEESITPVNCWARSA